MPVLLAGRLRPDLGRSGVHEGIPVVDLRHPDVLEDALARLAGPEVDPVLVLCHPEDHATLRAQLALASVAVPGLAPVLEAVPGTPLACAVTASLAADTPDVPCQLALLDELRTRLWSGVWLPSVTGLRHPAPRLGQHVRSWLPGSGFLAVSAPQPRVLAAGSAPLPEDLDLPEGATLMVADQGAPAWVREELLQRAGATSASRVDPWRDARDAFGTGVALDVVAVAPSLQERQVAGDAPPCPGCSRAHGREHCPFCGMSARPFDLEHGDAQ